MLEQFSNDCLKTNTKVITATNDNRCKQCNESIRIPSNYIYLAQSMGKIACTILLLLLVIGLPSHWLKNWCDILKPVTGHNNYCYNSNCGISFDSHLKTALYLNVYNVQFFLG